MTKSKNTKSKSRTAIVAPVKVEEIIHEMRPVARARKVKPVKKKKFLDFAISTVQANSGVQNHQYGAAQTMRARGEAAVSKFPPSGIKTETLADELGSEAYSVDRYELNPGRLTTVLRKIALNFQKFKFRHFILRWVPNQSVFAEAGRGGTILLGYRADPSDSVPETMPIAMNSDYKAWGLPSSELSLDLTAALNKKFLMVRSGRNPANTSILDYDPGFFFLASEGVQQQSPPKAAGYLVVDYAVDFQEVIDEQIVVHPPTQGCCSGYFRHVDSIIAPTSGFFDNAWGDIVFVNNGSEDLPFALVKDVLSPSVGRQALGLAPGWYRVHLRSMVAYSGVPSLARDHALGMNLGGGVNPPGLAGTNLSAPSYVSFTQMTDNAAFGSNQGPTDYCDHYFDIRVTDEDDPSTWILPVSYLQWSIAALTEWRIMFMISACS